MGSKKHTAEEIIRKLREAEVVLAQGQTIGTTQGHSERLRVIHIAALAFTGEVRRVNSRLN